MDDAETVWGVGATLGTMSERQQQLMAMIQGLNPDLRHTLEIECRGAEPWKVSVIREHRDIQLKGGSKPETRR